MRASRKGLENEQDFFTSLFTQQKAEGLINNLAALRYLLAKKAVI